MKRVLVLLILAAAIGCSNGYSSCLNCDFSDEYYYLRLAETPPYPADRVVIDVGCHALRNVSAFYFDLGLPGGVPIAIDGTGETFMVNPDIPEDTYELTSGIQSYSGYYHVTLKFKDGLRVEADNSDLYLGRLALDYSAYDDGVFHVIVAFGALAYQDAGDELFPLNGNNADYFVRLVKKDGKVTIFGDVDFDGYVNVNDVSSIYKCILGGEYDVACDINGNGFINVEDVSYLYRIILGQ